VQCEILHKLEVVTGMSDYILKTGLFLQEFVVFLGPDLKIVSTIQIRLKFPFLMQIFDTIVGG
jgi:hypothetical protein